MRDIRTLHFMTPQPLPGRSSPQCFDHIQSCAPTQCAATRTDGTASWGRALPRATVGGRRRYYADGTDALVMRADLHPA